MNSNTGLLINLASKFSDYWELCKPRVVALMLITAIVAMLLAVPVGSPIPWLTFLFASIGIACAASAGAIMNHIIDRHIDAVMQRTHSRPIATGRIQPHHAMLLASILAITSMLILGCLVNIVTAILSFMTLIGYAIIYTVFLKRATPQNIVIGGLAGAMPPLLGWSAISGDIAPGALLLVLIIFVWTPPHFWALAVHRQKEYAKVNIPMLPVTHGIQFTKLCIILYTALLIACTYLPFVIRMSGVVYIAIVTLINITFAYQIIRMYFKSDTRYALRAFYHSILYLFILFIALLADHYCLVKI